MAPEGHEGAESLISLLERFERDEDLRELLKQHWLHSRHLENERAQFMQMFAVVIAAVLTYLSTGPFEPDRVRWPLCLLVLFTFFGFFLTMRWIYAFECHRSRVGKIIRIILSESKIEEIGDLTMEIPKMHIVPRRVPSRKELAEMIKNFLQKNKAEMFENFFRTRYWFPLFYLAILVFLSILSFIENFSVWDKGLSIVLTGFSFYLFYRYYVSLEEIKKR